MNDALLFTVNQNQFGHALIACSDKGIAALLFGDTVDELITDAKQRFRGNPLSRDDAQLQSVGTDVTAFLNGSSPTFDSPLDLRGSEFQKQVWQTLQSIPRGTTVSYSELALKLGRPSAVRAVASACGANPVAVIIPCHRVLRRDNSLGGYRWGLERKRQLLKLEGAL